MGAKSPYKTIILIDPIVDLLYRALFRMIWVQYLVSPVLSLLSWCIRCWTSACVGYRNMIPFIKANILLHLRIVTVWWDAAYILANNRPMRCYEWYRTKLKGSRLPNRMLRKSLLWQSLLRRRELHLWYSIYVGLMRLKIIIFQKKFEATQPYQYWSQCFYRTRLLI